MNMQVARRINPIAVADEAHRALMATADPAEIRKIEATLDAAESLMRATGLYLIDEMRPVNEERMRARWCLGVALAAFVRQQTIGPGRGKVGGKTTSVYQTSFRAYLKQIELDKSVAHEAQRIASMPDAVLTKAILLLGLYPCLHNSD